ncbi:hypothetical protein DQ353_00160 [Arthrobacter sp. AQ5-05]|uniref:hypothetical protein n=1 Tax=Arthrobacter sp. AQ5-05 TaxID=2184581 RepID=UPI000DCC3FFD|nr:hypothetical protein [Arthrobacter sp. AQ5-05]RAX50851.1 hypothetical protein DQ353_00160 [Arthrobacter sp. AQ5-05]
MDEIPALVGLASPVATALAMLYLIFTGKLVTLAQHNTIVRLMEARNADALKDRDAWRSTSDRKGETIAVLTNSNHELMESAKFSNHVMTALQERAGE